MQALIAPGEVVDDGEFAAVGAPAWHGQDAFALHQRADGAGGEVHQVNVEIAFIARIGGVGDAAAIGGKAAEVVNDFGRRGAGARGAAGFQQPELLAFVAAGIDAPDQPVIIRGAAQGGDFFGVGAERLGVVAIGIHHPDLRQAAAERLGAAQVEDAGAIFGEIRPAGGADLYPGIGGDGHMRWLRRGCVAQCSGAAINVQSAACARRAAAVRAAAGGAAGW